eukprot:2587375-Prymnesium_polylepis.1
MAYDEASRSNVFTRAGLAMTCHDSSARRGQRLLTLMLVALAVPPFECGKSKTGEGRRRGRPTCAQQGARRRA